MAANFQDDSDDELNSTDLLPCEFCEDLFPSNILVYHQSGCNPALLHHPVKNLSGGESDPLCLLEDENLYQKEGKRNGSKLDESSKHQTEEKRKYDTDYVLSLLKERISKYKQEAFSKTIMTVTHQEEEKSKEIKIKPLQLHSKRSQNVNKEKTEGMSNDLGSIEKICETTKLLNERCNKETSNVANRYKFINKASQNKSATSKNVSIEDILSKLNDKEKPRLSLSFLSDDSDNQISKNLTERKIGTTYPEFPREKAPITDSRNRRFRRQPFIASKDSDNTKSNDILNEHFKKESIEDILSKQCNIKRPTF